MRNLLQMLCLILIVQFTNAYATSYLKFWINGSEGNTVQQGDVFAWEFDVASPGNTADVELWIDLDKSRSITDGDILLDVLNMTDGDLDDDGPVDSSATPDGILYIELGQFGFGVENYYMKAIDEDESSASNWF